MTVVVARPEPPPAWRATEAISALGTRMSFAAVAWHHGAYDAIGQAHRAVEMWLHQERKEISGPPWEVYWTGPSDDPDPAKWVTEVGYPFR